MEQITQQQNPETEFNFKGFISGIYLKDFFKLNNGFNKEININITETEFKSLNMCPANVSLLSYSLFSSCFIEYSIKENLNICVNPEQIFNILKSVKNENIKIEITNKHLFLTLISDITEKHKIDLIDYENKTKYPDLNFSGNLEIETKTFKDLISKNKGFSVMEFIKNETETTTEIKVYDSDELKNTITLNNKGYGCFKSKYSIEYLNTFIKNLNIKDIEKLKFNLSDDYPLNIDILKSDYFQIKFLLAPRCNND